MLGPADAADSIQVAQCRALIPGMTVFCGCVAFAVSTEIIVDETHGPLTAPAAAAGGRDHDLPGGLPGPPGAPDRAPPLAVARRRGPGPGAVAALCWAVALPGVLAMVATAVRLAGIGMWFESDAAGAMRTMGA